MYAIFEKLRKNDFLCTPKFDLTDKLKRQANDYHSG